MKDAILRFWNDEDGATAIEYGLIAGLIAVVIAVGATTLGATIKELFCDIAKSIDSAASCTKTTP